MEDTFNRMGSGDHLLKQKKVYGLEKYFYFETDIKTKQIQLVKMEQGHH